MTFARLKPDVTPERAEADAGAPVAGDAGNVRRRPGFREEWRVRPLRDRRVGDAARVAWLLIGAVAIFLLIACVNVTNLMLARVAERQREFAVRAAVGAGKIRLARLALAESLLLALAAGGIGLLVGVRPPRDVRRDGAGRASPGVADASIDLRVFVVAALLVVITGMAIGLWPAISVFRAGGLQGLRSTATSSPGARPRVRFALVTTQIALTLALLGGSALLLRSLWNVVNVPLGFDAERVITLTAALSPVRYPTVEHGAAFFEELLARARATPGAVSAALSDAPPPPRPPRGGWTIMGRVEGRPVDPNAPQPHDPLPSGDAALLRNVPNPGWSRAGRSRRPIGPASRRSCSTNRPNESCLPESARSDGAFGPRAVQSSASQAVRAPVVHGGRGDRGRPKRSGPH